jgi:hypothetical protein
VKLTNRKEVMDNIHLLTVAADRWRWCVRDDRAYPRRCDDSASFLQRQIDSLPRSPRRFLLYPAINFPISTAIGKVFTDVRVKPLEYCESPLSLPKWYAVVSLHGNFSTKRLTFTKIQRHTNPLLGSLQAGCST